MRRSVMLLLIPFLLIAQPSPDERTRQVLDLWIAGKYDVIYGMCDKQMKTMPLAEYNSQFERLKSLGKIQSIGGPRRARIGNYDVVTIPLTFPPTAIDFRVVWDANGQIAGLTMNPPAAPPVAWQAPAYVNPDSFSERGITVGDDPWRLPGTLTVPKGKPPFPAVALVHGSGPNDRDESIGGSKIFKDLAQGLATRGIAVLRYEKRNKVYRAQCIADKDFTMTKETVEDAVRAAALARTLAEIDPARVFVLGHSQGGYMAPRIAAADPKLAGLILLAGNVRPLEELIREQAAYLGQPAPASLPLPAAYLDDLKGYNPAALAAGLAMPMLILQGERDFQVTMQDLALWKSALAKRTNVTFHSYPKLNHLFIAGEGRSMPAEYEKPGHADAQVIADIATWIKSIR